jgi:hypothetical protein
LSLLVFFYLKPILLTVLNIPVFLPLNIYRGSFIVNHPQYASVKVIILRIFQLSLVGSARRSIRMPFCFNKNPSWQFLLSVQDVYGADRKTLAREWYHFGLLLAESRASTLERGSCHVLTIRELKSSGWYAGWWVTSCYATQREKNTLVKTLMLLSILKNDLPHNSFILQTLISSSCMFSRGTIKHPLLPTPPRSVGLSSPTSPV